MFVESELGIMTESELNRLKLKQYKNRKIGLKRKAEEEKKKTKSNSEKNSSPYTIRGAQVVQHCIILHID
jgi:hypothetical protein